MNAPFIHIAPTKPSPVASMSRMQLARWAYDQALAKLKADAKAGRIQTDAALLKFNAIRGAYQKRKQDLELVSFMRGRGLEFILDRKVA